MKKNKGTVYEDKNLDFLKLLLIRDEDVFSYVSGILNDLTDNGKTITKIVKELELEPFNNKRQKFSNMKSERTGKATREELFLLATHYPKSALKVLGVNTKMKVSIQDAQIFEELQKDVEKLKVKVKELENG